MGVNDYITINYKRLYQIAKNVAKGSPLVHDLFQHVIEVILTDDNKEKIEHMVNNDQLHFYFTALCIRNYNSNTSRFHYIFRKPQEANSQKDVYTIQIEDEEYDHDRELKLQFIDENISELPFYERKMVELYFEEGLSYQKISDLTGIPKTSCYNTITKIKQDIREKKK